MFITINEMYKTLNKKGVQKKKSIPVQRYIRKGEENKKGTRRFWRSINYTLKVKDDEVWLNEWRVKNGNEYIYFDIEPTQDEIRKKIEKEKREEEERKKSLAKRKQERIEKDNKKKIRKAKLDAERKEIEDASNIMLRHYKGIQRIKIPRTYSIPGENWKDNKTHMDVERSQIDNVGHSKYRRERKSDIDVTILVPNDKDFTISQLNRDGDWELGFKVCEMPTDDYKSEDGGIVKSGLFTVVKGKGFGNDYRAKWYE